MLIDVYLKKTYSTENDDLLNEFYIPVLKESVYYRRITGFFSSTSLLLAAQGIAYFFSNEGRYDLISGVIIENKDYEAIKKGVINVDDLINNKINFNPAELENELERDHLRILSWLIGSKRLRIKIAVLPENSTGLFHEKIGILEDKNGNTLSFSGSINETGSGWLGNIEEFKVFRGWIEEEKGYLNRDIMKFTDYWNNKINNFSVVDIPEAIEEQILKIRPVSEEEIEGLIQKIKNRSKRKELYEYQKNAILNWQKNNYVGIFEMATGTGKTVTSLHAVYSLYKEKKEFCAIIAVPYKHLVTQWLKDIKQELPDSIVVEVYGDNPKWREKLPKFLRDYQDGFIDKLIVITLYDSLASSDFLKIFLNSFNSNRNYILVADEMHNFGAPEYSKGMISEIRIRLGLSATPTRWFDEEGTQRLIGYFDKTVFVYDLKMAIVNGYLTPYDYFPILTQMTTDEFDEYASLSQKIIKKLIIAKDKREEDLYLKLLTLKRSKILKNSKSKLVEFESLISQLKIKSKIDHLLVYCDSEKQLIEAQKIINKLGIVSHRFTERENIVEREEILSAFDRGEYDCLIAMKCLDEGVNVPSTRTAIILASSTNPREYVQRRGRVLRKFPGKNKATIYDFMVLPPPRIDDKFFFSIEQKILKKELNRVQDFLETASNKSYILKSLGDTMLEYKVYLD